MDMPTKPMNAPQTIIASHLWSQPKKDDFSCHLQGLRAAHLVSWEPVSLVANMGRCKMGHYSSCRHLPPKSIIGANRTVDPLVFSQQMSKAVYGLRCSSLFCSYYQCSSTTMKILIRIRGDLVSLRSLSWILAGIATLDLISPRSSPELSVMQWHWKCD